MEGEIRLKCLASSRAIVAAGKDVDGTRRLV